MPTLNLLNPDSKLGRLPFRIHAARLVAGCLALLFASFVFYAGAAHSFTPNAVKPIYNTAGWISTGSFILLLAVYTPVITILRLRDVGLPAHLVTLLLVPGVGTLLFMALVVLPANWREENSETEKREQT